MFGVSHTTHNLTHTRAQEVMPRVNYVVAIIVALLALFSGLGRRGVVQGAFLGVGANTRIRQQQQQQQHGGGRLEFQQMHSFAAISSLPRDDGAARKTSFSASTGDGGGGATSTLTYREVVHLWRESSAFRDVFIDSLAGETYPAFFWETPPITRDTIDDREYEHVVKPARNLDGVTAEPEVFDEHLSKACAASASVATFPNLGGDAMLVSPCKDARLVDNDGAHFASFLRGAPREMSHELLRAVGVAVEARVAKEPKTPVWVSTSGSGVSWLHVRLDRAPKYYTFEPYTRWPDWPRRHR